MMVKLALSIVFLTLSLPSLANDLTSNEIKVEAEVLAWFVVCEAISVNREEMNDAAITFKKYLNQKKIDVMNYPEDERNDLIKQARDHSLVLHDKRFIVASCKDLYKSIINVERVK